MITPPHPADSNAALCLLCQEPSQFRFVAMGHHIVRCASCDLEWVHPTPSAEAISAVYEAAYFSGGGCGYQDYFEAEKAATSRKAAHRTQLLQRLGVEPGARLLDLGAADGTFVAHAQTAGLEAYGVEISAEARAAAAAPARLFSSLDEATNVAPFDVITLWDVLEHLPEPVVKLQALVELLKPGALLGIVVPVIDNWNARHLPATWDQYKPPEHLTYFSCQSLRALLEREVGHVVHEEPAWRRYARRRGFTSKPEGLRARLSSLEQLGSKWAARIGLTKKSDYLDSVLMVARVPPK